MNPELETSRPPKPPAERVICADSMVRSLLAVAVPPEQRQGDALQRVPVLGRRGELPDEIRRRVLAADAVAEAVPLNQIGHVDAEAVAEWIVGQYPADRYRAVVLGSAHGAAVQLAAACGAAWLPTSFTVTAPWPGGDAARWPAAMIWGSQLGRRILEHNPAVTVRQVHDPVLRGALCGATVSLQVRWRELPAAYREFVRSRLAPGGASVLVRDLRTWPVLPVMPRLGFQIGSPAAGWSASDYSTQSYTFLRLLRAIGAGEWMAPGFTLTPQYADTSGEAAIERELRDLAQQTGTARHRVYYSEPHELSAAVADLHRTWMRPVGGGRGAVVGGGRLTDPWAAIDTGTVPYWCESASREAADAAELWLAASEPFDRVSVLPDPPGTPDDGVAPLTHWRSLARFARHDGTVDTVIAGRYPLLPPAPGHAARVLRHSGPAVPRPQPMPAGEAVLRLAQYGSGRGLLIA